MRVRDNLARELPSPSTQAEKVLWRFSLYQSSPIYMVALNMHLLYKTLTDLQEI